MTTERKAPTEQPRDGSEKVRMTPPKELGPKGGKPWGGQRGSVGEFTGAGSPGLQKK